MIVADRNLIGQSKKSAYPDVSCLYSTLPREMRMHMHRVADYGQLLAQAAWKEGIFPQEIVKEEGGLLDYTKAIFRLHDIGRHYVPESIYNKVENLTEEEKEEIKRHTVYAKKALQSVFFPPFTDDKMIYCIQTAMYHHERWDGSGYPEGRKGEAIPFLARICAIADTYDGMVSWKPYRPRMERQEALMCIKKDGGGLFQRELAELFADLELTISLLDLKNGNVGTDI